MTLQELEDAPEHQLPYPAILYRVQRVRTRPSTVLIGPLKLPPRGLLTNRFDLLGDDVGYFAEADVTATYETIARREATSVSMAGDIATRELLTLQSTRRLKLLDLRGKAHDWPVLQATRFGPTQALAAAAQAAGYEGIVYRSAQQYDADCYAIFGRMALGSLLLLATTPLALPHPSIGFRPHRVMANALRGSQVTLTP